MGKSTKAITWPTLDIVLGGKLTGSTLGERMVTGDGVYELVEIGCPELHGGDEVGISFKWRRVDG